MSTWTSERARAALALGAALVLSGCFEPGGMVPSLSRDVPETRMFRDPGGLTIVGPRGYCVDPENSRSDGGAGFVLLGGCDVLADARRGPRHHAILSATFAPADAAPGVRDYAAFMASSRGREMLSRTDDPATVTILDSRVEGDMLLLHVRDTSPNTGAPLAQEHWRAAFFTGGHAVMLSVHSTEGSPLATRTGRSKITDFARAVQRAN